MLIDFECLTLEITRRCGMKCAHCMRGEPQDVQIDYDAIQTLCKATSNIDHLNLTGGEPSLEPNALRYLLFYLKNYDCRIGAFFCATNAQKYSKEFADILTDLYHYCEHPELCMLTISIDQFHSEADPLALQEYRKLPFYNPINEKGNIPKSNILDEGRANDNGIGMFSMPISPYIYDVELDICRVKVRDRLYINVFGDVLLDADMSYLTQESESIGNILSQSLLEIIMANTFKIPEHWHVPDEKEMYCIHVKTDKDIFVKGVYEDKKFFPTARDASAVYHRIIHNIHMTPINPEISKAPDGLTLVTERLEENSVRCVGTKINYIVPGETKHKAVEIEVLRCPLGGSFDDYIK